MAHIYNQQRIIIAISTSIWLIQSNKTGNQASADENIAQLAN